MIHVIASITVKAGARADFVELFKSNVPNVLQEYGCIEYFPATDVNADMPIQAFDENVVTVIEKWETMAALQAHRDAPHMLTFREKAKDFIETVSAKVLENA